MLSDKAIQELAQDIMDGRMPKVTICNCNLFVFADYESIGCLDQRITERHIPGLLRLVENGNEHSAHLALRLLTRFVHMPEVNNLLWRQWERNDLPLQARITVHAKLCDVMDLDPDQRRTLWRWIKGNREWFDAVREWVGGSDKVIQFCEERLANPIYPDSKNWLYYMSAIHPSA